MIERANIPQLWPDQMPYPMSFSIKTFCHIFSYKIYYVHLALSVVERSRQVKVNPLTIGRERSFTCVIPLLCTRQSSRVFLPSLNLHSNPERKVVFSLFCKWGPLRLVGCSSSGNKGAVELGWEMKPSFPANLLVWDCGVFSRTWIRVREGWRVSCPVVPIYTNALEIVPAVITVVVCSL